MSSGYQLNALQLLPPVLVQLGVLWKKKKLNQRPEQLLVLNRRVLKFLNQSLSVAESYDANAEKATNKYN